MLTINSTATVFVVIYDWLAIRIAAAFLLVASLLSNVFSVSALMLWESTWFSCYLFCVCSSWSPACGVGAVINDEGKACSFMVNNQPTRCASTERSIPRTSLQRLLHSMKLKPYQPKLVYGLLENDPDRRLHFFEIMRDQFVGEQIELWIISSGQIKLALNYLVM